MKIVLQNSSDEFFNWWIETVLDFIWWIQIILKKYINKTYKLDFSEDTNIDTYLKKLVELNVQINID